MPSLAAAVTAIRPSMFAELEAAIASRRAGGGDLVPLHIGDTHRAPPAAARYEAQLAGARDEDLYAYGATVGLAELRDALCVYAASKGRGFAGMSGAANVQLGVGATHALSCAARVVLGPGDDALLAAPYWPLAHGIVASTGAWVIEVVRRESDADAAEAFERALTPKTRAIYMITPNNPDGRVLSRSDLAAIGRLAVKHDLWVIADEVYADYAFASDHHALSREDGMAERTISAFSFSHALAGARVGYVLAPAGVVSAMRKLSTHSVFNGPVLMQRSALAALGDEAWVAEARADYLRARDSVSVAFEGSGARFRPAEGGVYLFVDFSELLGGRPLRRLLELAVARGVLLAPGEAFGEAFSTSARLCYSSAPLPRVLEGVARLREAIADL